eukprot:TRINITY_DN3069_c0_g1_i2.p1 TRINITY_DN3069_c0_g1~~TRINITY_DN3069_c0_g1_i2.p1  ORF type:complete len:281 (-),score=58.89 TRINITY_DN3069_c0_g1_i2:193-1035(-)
MEEHDPTLSHSANMIAGATAGMMEHVVMFPVDTIKTRLQSAHGANSPYRGVFRGLTHIIKTEGAASLFRGVGAVASGAAPAHALYFATYEITKDKLSPYVPLAVATSIAGACATTASDAIMTPWDVVKQRLQMENSPYKGVTDCVKRIFQTEGIRAFYLSYPATLTMNIPFVSVHFTTYEFMYPVFSSVFHKKSAEDDDSTSTISHFLAGGSAGAAAAAISNPLDVAKTRLQTQVGNEKKYTGLIQTVGTIVREEGASTLLRGITSVVSIHSISQISIDR